jgi:DNA-binding MarR family transcriptional regulator
MRLRDLGELMRVRYSQPGLSRLVQRMEVDGTVDRRIDPADRRATVVSLTRAGRTRFRRAYEVYASALHEQLGGKLSPAAAASLTSALDDLAARRAGLSG